MANKVKNPEAAAIQSVNDFVVKFANVNGSGSASRQFRSSPVDPADGHPGKLAHNIFPSNIQGLPTWVRKCGSARERPSWPPRRRRPGMGRDEPGRTWDEGRPPRSSPAGYLFYDSTKPLPPSKFRD